MIVTFVSRPARERSSKLALPAIDRKTIEASSVFINRSDVYPCIGFDAAQEQDRLDAGRRYRLICIQETDTNREARGSEET
jgi:hypothetical protein